jgi:AcrR family transcriptional regulator
MTVDALPRPGRPRSEAADLAIRQATVELLASDGYANVTMSGIAARAGVSTATLYRRWRSKLELVVDVLQARADERPVVDTGSLAGDFHALVDAIVEATRSTGILPGLIGEISRNPELAAALRKNLFTPRRAVFVGLLERAEARRELRPGLDRDLVIDLVCGPVYTRLLLTGAPVTRRVTDQLIELVLRAVRPEADGR